MSPNKGCIIIHPMRRSRCFVLDLSISLRSSSTVKTKAYSYAFMYINVIPPILPLELSAKVINAKLMFYFYIKQINI